MVTVGARAVICIASYDQLRVEAVRTCHFWAAAATSGLDTYAVKGISRTCIDEQKISRCLKMSRDKNKCRKRSRDGLGCCEVSQDALGDEPRLGRMLTGDQGGSCYTKDT